MHGIVMVWLFMIPSIPAAFGNFLLPIMIGAKDVAFPRLNLRATTSTSRAPSGCSSRCWMGGVDTGWTFYAPYSAHSPSAGRADGARDLHPRAGRRSSRASTSSSRRTRCAPRHRPGSGCRSSSGRCTATSIIQVLATPVLGLSLVHRRHRPLARLGPLRSRARRRPGALPAPVLVLLAPGRLHHDPARRWGSSARSCPTFSHKNPSSYKAIAYSTLGIAFVGFLTWGHHMFVAGMSRLRRRRLRRALDAGRHLQRHQGLHLGAHDATGARSSFATPLLYFFAFLFLFVFGGMTGVAVATQSLDVHWHDTYFVVAHFHFIMVGGTLTAFLAALHYWFPKMTGRMYSERWGCLGATLVFAGFFVTFFPQFLLGNAGMPRRYYDYTRQFQPLHVISTVGSWILGAGMLITLGYLVVALVHGRARAGDNPWDSRSYEWLTPSPPPKHNFTREPRVRARPVRLSTRCRTRRTRSSMPMPRDGRRRALRGPRRGRRTPRASGCGSSSGARCSSSRASSRSTRPTASSTRVGFGEGVHHNTLALGLDQHGVLLVSSYTIALAVHELRRGRRGRAALLIGGDHLPRPRASSASRRPSTSSTSTRASTPAASGDFYPEHTRARDRRCSSRSTSA